MRDERKREKRAERWTSSFSIGCFGRHLGLGYFWRDLSGRILCGRKPTVAGLGSPPGDSHRGGFRLGRCACGSIGCPPRGDSRPAIKCTSSANVAPALGSEPFFWLWSCARRSRPRGPATGVGNSVDGSNPWRVRKRRDCDPRPARSEAHPAEERNSGCRTVITHVRDVTGRVVARTEDLAGSAPATTIRYTFSAGCVQLTDRYVNTALGSAASPSQAVTILGSIRFQLLKGEW